MHRRSPGPARAPSEQQLARLADLQDRLWAEAKRSVLVVLQGIDAAGKDGTINKVMEAFNPQGCSVTSFKVPSDEELAHDYLWRVHQKVPRTGEIGIFNRSHYEDVLVVRVHDLVPREVWSARYDQINEFERILADNGTAIVKFFLAIDRDEQRERFQARYDRRSAAAGASPDDEHAPPIEAGETQIAGIAARSQAPSRFKRCQNVPDKVAVMPLVVSVTVTSVKTTVIGGVQSGWNVGVSVSSNVAFPFWTGKSPSAETLALLAALG